MKWLVIVASCFLLIVDRQEEVWARSSRIQTDDGSNGKTQESDNNVEEPQSRVYYNQSQLWKTFIDDVEDIQVLAGLRDEGDISMWGGNTSSVDILVKPSSLKKVRKALNTGKVPFEVVIEDLQKAIDEENPPYIELDDRRGYKLTWEAYHRLSIIHEYVAYLAQTYPQLCSAVSIGRSAQGREIPVLKISNNRPGNKAIWVDGGIHAREWISPATVTFIINQLVFDYENQPEYIKNLDWYIAPILNPDGYEYTHTIDRLWRKNRARGGYCAGTDLNRNFGYKWGGLGASTNPCAETYGGSSAFSEPETRAINNFVTKNGANWKGYVSFHSYGQYILFPWGYDRLQTDDYNELRDVGLRAADAIRQVTGSSYKVGPAGLTLYPAAGGSDDWAKGSIGMKYAYTIELRDTGRHGFVLPAAYIDSTAKEAFAALKVIALAAYNS